MQSMSNTADMEELWVEDREVSAMLDHVRGAFCQEHFGPAALKVGSTSCNELLSKLQVKGKS